MFRKLPAFLAVLVFSNFILAAAPIKRVEKSNNSSTIIVQNARDLEKDYLLLDGLWDYYKLDFVKQAELYPQSKRTGQLVTTPHYLESNINYATYHCRIEGLVANKHYGMSIYGRILSCSRIWCNRQLVGVSGFLNTDKHSSKAAQSSEIIDLLADQNGVIDIVIHVADFELQKRGIVKNLAITEKLNLEKRYMRLIFFSAFVIAFLLALIIYNLILMAMNRKSLLYFSLIMLSSFFILSIASSGVSILNLLFPEIPFSFEFRLPVLLLNINICTYIFYMGISRRIPGKYATTIYIISFAVSVIVAAVPLKTFEQYETIFIITPLCFLLLTLLFSFKFVLKRNLKAKGFFTLDATLYNFDMLVNTGILVAFFYDFLILRNKDLLINSCVGFKIAIFLFGIMQCAIPAFRRYFTNYRIQQSAERFELNNNLLAKFIPEQVLKFMNAEDVTKITLGSCNTFDAMILYTEVKYFKQLEEFIDEKNMLKIILKLCKEIAPLVRAQGGYIARYMYHGFLSVFPERNDAPIRCAMKMQEKMNLIQRDFRKKLKADISIGISIHTGKIASGVIGTEKLFDCITFSPDINKTIKIGTQTSKTGSGILITEEAMLHCRTYTDCMYEGHFILIDGKNILVYNAMPFKEFDKNYDGSLEVAEEAEEKNEA